MIEAQERGWWSSDRHVCAECVSEHFLNSLVKSHADHATCDFCGVTSVEPAAAPLDVVLEAVADALLLHFSEPSSASAPWDDGNFMVSTYSTEDVLLGLNLECADKVFEAIAGSFDNDVWVESADGHWAASPPNEILSYSWRNFEQTVKHRTRYFFQRTSGGSETHSAEIPAEEILNEICRLALEIGLIQVLPIGQKLYRCRLRASQDTWSLNREQLSAPPAELARAGRMNPAGISYLYTALQSGTAIAETVGHPPVSLVMASFTNVRQLTVLNFCNLPELPSVFDAEQRSLREYLLFLHEFTTAISRPVNKDGREHIEYVPSQVVSEYFAQVLKHGDGRVGVDGIIYPSAVLPGGENLVLFPETRRANTQFNHIKLAESKKLDLDDWRKLTSELYQADSTQ
ncbi:HEPN-associated N-terminal domain-containing protein [Janthinobacterium sp.]|uniref:HEPN-associated N-terminal domain-containing protein n=1 Tax=Janthinobacterium sp. TaxID=1871054 RepID=UPI00293D3693|nr:HEPN-associated N-terminal domain-containing protein [Janthinobacterium sp.]